jgi:hypothetical protein
MYVLLNGSCGVGKSHVASELRPGPKGRADRESAF